MRIADNIQRDALTGPRFRHRLILRVQPAHAHRFIDAGQPQRIANVNFAGKRRPGDHQPRAFDGKRPVDRQAKTLMLWVSARGKLQEMIAQPGDTQAFRRRDGKQGRAGKAELRQRRLDLRLHFLNPRRFYAVRFGQRHG